MSASGDDHAKIFLGHPLREDGIVVIPLFKALKFDITKFDDFMLIYGESPVNSGKLPVTFQWIYGNAC